MVLVPGGAVGLLAAPVIVIVMSYGELSSQALAAVLGAGCVLAALALRRRAGSAAAPITGAGLPWLAWLLVVGGWELLTLVQKERIPTLSDLTDHVLADPVARGAATTLWLAAGWWLVTRPSTSWLGTQRGPT